MNLLLNYLNYNIKFICFVFETIVCVCIQHVCVVCVCVCVDVCY